MDMTSRKILIVCEQKINGATLTEILKHRGFETICVFRGEEAIQILSDESIALIIIDIQLPETGGLKLLDRLKKVSPETKCIIVAESALADLAIQAAKLGAYSYIPKPYEVDHLVLTINQALEKKETSAVLTQSGMRYRQFYESALDGIVTTDLEGNLTDFNESYRVMLGYSEEELKSLNFWEITPKKWVEFEKKIVNQILNRGYSGLYEKEYIHKKSHTFPVELSAYLTRDAAGNPSGMWAFCRDISDRKESEELLKRQLKEMTALHGIAQAGIEVENIDILIEKTTEVLVNTLYSDNSGIVIYDSERHWLYPHYSYHGLEYESFKSGGSANLGVTGRCVKSRKPQIVDDVREDKDYLEFRSKTRSEIAVPIITNNKTFGVINAESSELGFFTQEDLKLLTSIANQLAIAIERIDLLEEQKQRTKEMRVLYDIANATGSVLEIEKIYRNLYEKVRGIFSLDTFILVRQLTSDGLINVDFAVEEGNFIDEWINTKFDPESSGLIGWVVREEKPLLCADITKEKLPVEYQQTGKQTRSWLGIPLLIGGRVIGGMSVQSFKSNQYTPEHQRLLESIGATVASAINNADLLKQTQRQIDQLAALHDIDMVINSSMDLRVSLNILLDQVIDNLKVDAAAVLLLNPGTQCLEYAAGRGFRTQKVKKYKLQMDDSVSGKAAMEQHLVQALNLDEGEDDPIYMELMEEEGFESFYSAPLIAKGQVKGMLDIFNRNQLNPDQEWFNFLETLAGQAAIAIDNTTLLNDLNQSNIELKLAYETTLEGWSRALDMRDRETEGHTQRVTRLTEKISREMGVPEEEIVHIRRGALLHDIGKMGIPDKILHKPGPLTDEEWDIMRRHPTYAYELLHPIQHLRLALTIPFCHHEKWDGSGYPRHLKGEEIPLAARIFAVVDVWDALTSNRPYRDAWSEKKSLDYIRQEKGKHFDPTIVDIFFRMIKDEILKPKE
jgi:PAS domain S-box-containing protein/putative nucleotidyltransferase with HDIG domain